MSHNPSQPMNNKELYTGDPNATLTMCYRKRRRHLSSDFGYEILPADDEGKVNVRTFCRHCKENPFLTAKPESPTP